MIVSEQEVTARLESPSNLLNRLRAASSNSKNRVSSPLLPPTADELVEDLEEKLKVNSIKNKAQSIMIQAMDVLESKIEEVSKPESLARIAETMSKISESQTAKDKAPKVGTIVIYSPQVMSEKDFGEVIDISSRE